MSDLSSNCFEYAKQVPGYETRNSKLETRSRFSRLSEIANNVGAISSINRTNCSRIDDTATLLLVFSSFQFLVSSFIFFVPGSAVFGTSPCES